MRLKSKPHQRDFSRDVAMVIKDTIWSFPKHTSATTYASAIGDVIIFKTVTFMRAGFRAGFRASHVVLVVAFVCGLSRDFRVCRRVTRRVPNGARVGVFCILASRFANIWSQIEHTRVIFTQLKLWVDGGDTQFQVGEKDNWREKV